MEKEVIMTVNMALSLRIKELLKLKNMSQYRLEQNSGVSHSQLGFILNNRNNSVNFKTVIMIALASDLLLSPTYLPPFLPVYFLSSLFPTPLLQWNSPPAYQKQLLK